MPAIASLEDLKEAQKDLQSDAKGILSPQSSELSPNERWLEEYLQALARRTDTRKIERGRRLRGT